ncbi:hypothetical protein [Mycolicibacterium mucogenicum]|uniref:Uncharacterized protein n=1 Tax=Mycolicibacterium mucogenicum DSM 44124 TaxID=1226753 RepID=A0A8H2J926_MYCMU|nr:hypothetical protein [Mycolicibacterium mucogenicum]KAB7761193.1 hypothetical protein MMUC44124_00940 [Mycolicibacterium mucogenicum DSM 44124]QPG69997.1 hypothetical protein C1S78_002925 [Mycolicibacterium mucogenicum DSM 44124]
MRIEIYWTALKNGITEAEIRAILNNYELRISIPTREEGIEADDYFYVGRAAANEPHIEVIADHIDPEVAQVFHAMMLKRNSVRELGLRRFIKPDFARQRRQRKRRE